MTNEEAIDYFKNTTAYRFDKLFKHNIDTLEASLQAVAVSSSIERMGRLVSEYFQDNKENLMGIEVGDTVSVNKPYHAEHGNQFIVEKIVPCPTSHGQHFEVSGTPINGGWVRSFTTPRLSIVSKRHQTQEALMEALARWVLDPHRFNGDDRLTDAEVNLCRRYTELREAEKE